MSVLVQTYFAGTHNAERTAADHIRDACGSYRIIREVNGEYFTSALGVSAIEHAVDPGVIVLRVETMRHDDGSVVMERSYHHYGGSDVLAIIDALGGLP